MHSLLFLFFTLCVQNSAALEFTHSQPSAALLAATDGSAPAPALQAGARGPAAQGTANKARC